MKNSKKLLQDVFQEVDVSKLNIEAAGIDVSQLAVPYGIDVCAYLAKVCLWNTITPSCGGSWGDNLDACEYVIKYC